MDEGESGRADNAAAPLAVGIVCPDCGYDLRGSTSARCPECGFGLDVLRTRETLIPWSHRRDLGWFKAYWKTVWLVLRYPKRFCLEMARPVSYADSQSFRWVTTGLAYLPILVGSLLWIVFGTERMLRGNEAEHWFIGGLLAWSLLALILLPGLASYFFQPRQLPTAQQNRAIALSYYAWAPLSATLLALPMMGILLLLHAPIASVRAVLASRGDTLFPTVATLLIGIGTLYVVAPLLAYSRLADIAWRTQHRRGLRGLLRMALLGLLSAVLLVLLGVPLLCAFYLLIIYHSLC